VVYVILEGGRLATPSLEEDTPSSRDDVPASEGHTSLGKSVSVCQLFAPNSLPANRRCRFIAGVGQAFQPLLSKTGPKLTRAEVFSGSFSTFAADLENNPHESEPGTILPRSGIGYQPGVSAKARFRHPSGVRHMARLPASRGSHSVLTPG
jgi:hypothetical protein